MKAELMNDLLNDPLFHWTDMENRSRAGCLPELLAVLADKNRPGVVGYDFLQAHQQHPWHAFLVQLAAMALHRSGTPAPGPADAAWWREHLLELAGGCAEAWHLAVEDLAKPAFLQPPLPDGVKALKNTAPSPDAVDLYQAAKDHDVKHSRAAHATEEQWVYALICLQTFQGFSGRGNYGIVRMNGGFGNRPGIGATPDFDLSKQYRRDVERLLQRRPIMLEAGWSEDGLPLLWFKSWDGIKQLALGVCDPFCVEVCRRIRLVQKDPCLQAQYGASKKARISGSEDLHGNIGDPWTPIERKSGKALTLGGDGFTYRKVCELLLGEWQSPICMNLDHNDRWWWGQALVRGQGQTDGYHERLIPLSKRVVSLLRRPDNRQRLGQRAMAMIEDAREMRGILHRSICALAQPSSTGAESKLDFKKMHGRSWLDLFDAEADEHFFAYLWDYAEEDQDAARAAWQGFLRDKARRLLEDAMDHLAAASTWRYRALNAAEGLFLGGVKKQFTALYAKEHAT